MRSGLSPTRIAPLSDLPTRGGRWIVSDGEFHAEVIGYEDREHNKCRGKPKAETKTDNPRMPRDVRDAKYESIRLFYGPPPLA
jgi:hypothetical protein